MLKNKRYSNRLRHYRLKRKLTQQAVLDALGHKSASRLSAWEQGNATPSVPHLFVLAGLYDVPIEKLYPMKRKHVARKPAIKREYDSPAVSSDEMTVEEQIDLLAQMIVEAYIAQKQQNFPQVGSSECH